MLQYSKVFLKLATSSSAEKATASSTKESEIGKAFPEFRPQVSVC